MRRAHEAIQGADATLAKPRPQAPWPAVESRSDRWRREANEEAARLAAERAASQPLTEFQASRLEARLTAQIGADLGEQRELLADSLVAVRQVVEAFEARIAELADELASLRADVTIAKAHKAEVIDLPTLPLRKRA